MLIGQNRTRKVTYPVCFTALSCSSFNFIDDPSGLVDTISSSFNVGV
jgi:hypothetical protein